MQCIGDISEEFWKDCITLFLQTEICCDAAIITNSSPRFLASYHEGNLFQLTEEEIQILLAREGREVVSSGNQPCGNQMLIDLGQPVH